MEGHFVAGKFQELTDAVLSLHLGTRESAALPCPVCDKPYSFTRDAISVCPSCGQEIEKADPNDEVPRITSSRKLAIVAAVVLFGGIVCLFFHPVGSVIGFVLIFAAIGTTNFIRTRCGNCGADLVKDEAAWCPTCGASFGFNVR